VETGRPICWRRWRAALMLSVIAIVAIGLLYVLLSSDHVLR
jgi:hypothetical protein